ncbi:MAG TPA: hypothetical protein VGS58_10280 [Candidatus Sulfopaludibacter sp.]|nr:hypothetical protein [Candidatus Sulfopaludibacter sp.]
MNGCVPPPYTLPLMLPSWPHAGIVVIELVGGTPRLSGTVYCSGAPAGITFEPEITSQGLSVSMVALQLAPFELSGTLYVRP